MSTQTRKDAESKSQKSASGTASGSSKQTASEDRRQASSQGDSPVEVTPKDVTPDDASWRDRTERKIASDNTEEREDALLDEAVDLTFPASDPIAIPTARDDAKARAGHGKTQQRR
jgi:hypothetical protein